MIETLSYGNRGTLFCPPQFGDVAALGLGDGDHQVIGPKVERGPLLGGIRAAIVDPRNAGLVP